MSTPAITRIILFVADIPKVAGFYQQYFGYQPLTGATAEWMELSANAGGCNIALHKAHRKNIKGDSGVKIVFGVADVEAFKKEKTAMGLTFGKTFEYEGLQFADTKDPAGNKIQISSRGI